MMSNLEFLESDNFLKISVVNTDNKIMISMGDPSGDPGYGNLIELGATEVIRLITWLQDQLPLLEDNDLLTREMDQPPVSIEDVIEKYGQPFVTWFKGWAGSTAFIKAHSFSLMYTQFLTMYEIDKTVYSEKKFSNGIDAATDALFPGSTVLRKRGPGEGRPLIIGLQKSGQQNEQETGQLKFTPDVHLNGNSTGK